MEYNCRSIVVIVYTAAILSQHASGTLEKLSDGDYIEKTREFPRVLKHLNEVSPIPLTKEEYLHYYVPLKSISEPCINDSKTYLQGLKDFEPWAIQMLDSSSKLPTGFMAAHVQDLGNFDECLEDDLKSPISRQYCMVEFHGILPKPWLRYKNVFILDEDSPLQKQNVPRLSFCLPSSCTAVDISEHFTQFVTQWNGTATTDKYSCTTGKNPPPSVIDWFALFCFIALNVNVIMSTIYELTVGRKYKNDKDPPLQHRILTTFSLYKNVKQLLKIRDPKRGFSVLNGLRVISIFWIMVGHHVLLSLLVPSVNYINLYKRASYWNMSWVHSGAFGVDTFLLIGGSLLSYMFLKEFSSGEKKFNFPLYFLHRYFRFTPVNYMAILIGSTWFSRLGDGPLWRPLTQRHSEYCEANWWTNILYINNYVEPNRQCLGYTWYLCVDMHLYLLSPLVLLPLLKYQRFAVIGLPVILLVSVAIPFTIVYAYELTASPFFTRGNQSVWNFSIDYTTTHGRAGPWVVGITLGYILHQLRDKKIQLSKITVMCGWIISLIVCLGTVYSVSYFHKDEYSYNRLQSALYVALSRTLWAIGVAWIIFACEKGYGGPVRIFLSWRGFQPLAKLTFSIYVIHFCVQNIIMFTARNPTYHNYRIWIKDIMGEFVIAVCLAVYLSMWVEVPFLNIEKLLFRRGPRVENETTQCTGKENANGTQEAVIMRDVQTIPT